MVMDFGTGSVNPYWSLMVMEVVMDFGTVTETSSQTATASETWLAVEISIPCVTT